MKTEKPDPAGDRNWLTPLSRRCLYGLARQAGLPTVEYAVALNMTTRRPTADVVDKSHAADRVLAV